MELGAPVRIGRLPDWQRKRNKGTVNALLWTHHACVSTLIGWEGVDILPAELTADGIARLLAVHEGKPRRLGVFSLHPDNWLATEANLKLPKQLKQHLKDLSDITVDTRTGRVLLLSDESQSIAEVSLEWSGSGEWTMQVHGIRLLLGLPPGAKPEGLAFDRSGRLWMCTDSVGLLASFTVEFVPAPRGVMTVLV